MATIEQTISRLNFRLPLELKEKIEQAAIVSGVTVTDFAISVLASSANDVLEKHQNRILSNRDRDIFLAMIENPPEPNEALKKAVQNYKKRAIKK